jgi:hypothetical protein
MFIIAIDTSIYVTVAPRAYICMYTGLYVFPCSSKAEIECRNKYETQNVHVVCRPKFHDISNGGSVFAVSLILCTGKWIQLFAETVLTFNLHL